MSGETPGRALRTEVALKVDVDTHAGARDGIPRLAALLRELGIRASFFVAMGPDNSGKALRRIFRQKGFLRKMLRTRGLGASSWRAPLYGTLLRPPLIGAGFPDLLRALEDDGHEVAPHGWDHVRWHDQARHLDAAAAREEILRAFEACGRAIGHPPLGAAAPGWQCTAAGLDAQEDLGLLYHSDTRGECPYLPAIGGRAYAAIEIPTTLPTLDEVIGTEAARRRGLIDLFDGTLREGRLNVFTAHAEAEGLRHREFLRGLLERWRGRGAAFVRLADAARELRSRGRPLPRAGIAWKEIPGRAGEVACQDAATAPVTSGARASP